MPALVSGGTRRRSRNTRGRLGLFAHKFTSFIKTTTPFVSNMSLAERIVASGGWDADRSTSLMDIIAPPTKIGSVCWEKKSHPFKPLDTHSLCHLDEELKQQRPGLPIRLLLSGVRYQQQQAGRTRRHVSFASSIVTQEIPPVVYEEDEVLHHALWYSKADHEAIAESNRQTVALVKSRGLGSESNQEYCKRGLESQLADSLSFLRSPQEIIGEVLDRQIDLWCEDKAENEQARLLAETYCIYASQYALKAILRGVSDWYSIQEGDTTSDSQPLTNEVDRMASPAPPR
jgi:hypothetical protein